ncbi:MAG: phosphatidylglycerol---prolipoprotein diacylglyceryl transferase [Sphingomonadales bacterium]|jgi:prolipoprotein diacylglyceryltransferase|nr:phosphatidylglycerol---prolipoprotein diacylglyceryl transferase [Sphingomonadales bacterium]MEA3042406.1 phosphatidylglycerol---prolipoprotein diacylglyceryl transferase [Sphingomonadales bacterium]MEA3047904.1 phosphatidylglycerol---prolipoprotein diacylglyceryl transferase [Sphingomonadales bacterium]
MLSVPTNIQLHLPFDILAWGAAGLLAHILYRWRLKEAAARIVARTGRLYVLAVAAGAIGGAWAFGSWNTGLMAVPHPSHSIAGALAGAILAVELYKWARGISGSTGTIWVGPIALGIAIGRWGCLFAGLPDETFGTPTDLPWSVDLGDGVARHPVQLYESLAMLAFLGVYLVALGRRAGWTRERAFYLFILWYAAQRFVWEFFKPYPRLVGPLDLFQLLALAMIAYALIFDARARRQP